MLREGRCESQVTMCCLRRHRYRPRSAYVQTEPQVGYSDFDISASTAACFVLRRMVSMLCEAERL